MVYLLAFYGISKKDEQVYKTVIYCDIKKGPKKSIKEKDCVFLHSELIKEGSSGK